MAAATLLPRLTNSTPSQSPSSSAAAPTSAKTDRSKRVSPPNPRNRLFQTYRHMALWTLQGWIAMFFIAAGYAKISEPMTNLIALMTWPALVSPALVRGVGIAEMALALGLLAPLVSWKIGRPILMVAASGLALLEAAMLVVHTLSLDFGLAAVNLVLLAMTLCVLRGRRASF